MNLSELMLFLHRLEVKYPVETWQMNGIHIWPIIRNNIGMTCTKARQNANREENKGSKWIARIRRVINPVIQDANLFIRDYKHNGRILPSDVVMYHSSATRTILLPTCERMDWLTGPIRLSLEACGYHVVEFESVSGIPKYPRWKTSFMIDVLLTMVLIKNRLMKNQNYDVDVDFYDDLKKECYEVGLSEQMVSSRQILNEVKDLEGMAKCFFALLTKIHPRIVILVGWDSVPSMALALAAHKLNLPVVEIQHGMAAGTGIHFAYYDWSKMPATGYEVMPDYMWVWWKKDYDSILQWGRGKVVPILGGRPTALLWGSPDNALNHYYVEKCKHFFCNGRITILFTLTWGAYYPDWVLDIINDSEKYIWLIRLHPVIDSNEEKFIRKLKRKKNIIWKEVDNVPLDFLLTRVSLHITTHSSVVIEGEEVGCPSIVLDWAACEMFTRQIQSGMVRYAGTRDSLLATIEDILSQGKRRGGEQRSKEFYVHGCDAIQRLTDIMESHRSRYAL